MGRGSWGRRARAKATADGHPARTWGRLPGCSQETPRERRDDGRVTGETLLLVDDEDNLRIDARGGAAPQRLRGAPGGHRARRPRRGRRRAARPDRARRDAPRPRWVRGVPALRAEGDRTPVVFLTARDATEDKVRGLTTGGDDYLVKPFSLDELVARIDAVLRRTGKANDAAVLRCCDLELDDDAHLVTRAGGEVPSPPPSTSCCATCSPTRAGCCRRPRSSTTCGSTTSAATAAWSRPTSATCARRLDHLRAEAHPHRPGRGLRAARPEVLRGRVSLPPVSSGDGRGDGRAGRHHRGDLADHRAVARRPARPAAGASRGAAPCRPTSPGDSRRRGGRPPSAVYVGVLDRETGDLRTLFAPSITASERPARPARPGHRLGSGDPAFTVPATDGGLRYRGEVRELPRTGNLLVTAAAHGGCRRHARSAAPTPALGSLAIVGTLGLVTFWVLRLGVRPIREMTDTAVAIGEGDLSQRIPALRAGHRGRRARRGPQPHARSHRGRVRRAHPLGGPAPAVRRRRLPRAADPARHHPWLRRAVPPRRPGRRRGPRRRHASHRAGGERMSALVNDLLALARFDQGRPIDQSPGRPGGAGHRRRGRCPGRRARAPDRPAGLRPRRSQPGSRATRPSSARSSANLLANAASTPRRTTPVHGVLGDGRAKTAGRGGGGARSTARAWTRRCGTSVRALLPGRPVPHPRSRAARASGSRSWRQWPKPTGAAHRSPATPVGHDRPRRAPGRSRSEGLRCPLSAGSQVGAVSLTCTKPTWKERTMKNPKALAAAAMTGAIGAGALFGAAGQPARLGRPGGTPPPPHPAETEAWPPRTRPPRRPRPRGASEVLGLTAGELRAELADGKTLAEVAEAQGVERQA
jgi:hypothetical protein